MSRLVLTYKLCNSALDVDWIRVPNEDGVAIGLNGMGSSNIGQQPVGSRWIGCKGGGNADTSSK